MQKIYLIRHGQASFGQHNYDQLSELGQQQARRLGDALSQRIGQVDSVVRGAMLRHHQTEELTLGALAKRPDTRVDANWNEFDHQAVLAAADQRFAYPSEMKLWLARQADPGLAFRHAFHRAMQRWMAGEDDNDYPESWTAFKQRVARALSGLTEQAAPRSTVLVFTSGGVIARIAQHLLQLPETQFINVNASLVNAGTTKLLLGRSGLRLSTLNDHSCFEGAWESLITYK